MYLASDLSNAAVVPTLPVNLTDAYEPCTVNPDHGYTVVYNVTLPAGATKNDTLSIEMCSPGGYDQVQCGFLHEQALLAMFHCPVLSDMSCSHLMQVRQRCAAHHMQGRSPRLSHVAAEMTDGPVLKCGLIGTCH